MEKRIESLDCPNCGAPLEIKHGDNITECLCCGSSIRVSSSSGEIIVPTTEVSPEVMEQVRQLILSGDREGAIKLYSSTAGVSREESEKAIKVVYDRITSKAILERPLRGKEYLITLVFSIVLILSFYSGIALNLTPVLNIIVWILFAYCLITLLAISPTIITTFKYLGGKWGKAKILKFSHIGDNKKIAIFRVLVEVQPDEGEAFRSHINVPVRIKNISKLQEGAVFKAKYLPDDKNSVITFSEH